jgi:hypothetical protein
MTLEDAKRKLANYDWKVEEAELKKLYGPLYREMVQTAGRDAVDAFDVDDPHMKKLATSYVAERVTQITETTRDKLQGLIQSRLEAGDVDVSELASEIREAYAFSGARAAMIARTETSIAYNHGGVLGYQQSGYSEVDVIDGDGDEECAAADGDTWTVEEALANPLEHPNCTRVFVPHEDDQEAV